MKAHARAANKLAYDNDKFIICVALLLKTYLEGYPLF